MELIEDGYFEGKNKSQTKLTENRAGTVDSVGVHGPPMPVHGVGSETQASDESTPVRKTPCLELTRSLRTKRRFIFSAMPLQLIDGATQEDPPECGTVPSN